MDLDVARVVGRQPHEGPPEATSYKNRVKFGLQTILKARGGKPRRSPQLDSSWVRIPGLVISRLRVKIVAHLNIPLVKVKLELVLHFGAALLEGRHSLRLAGSAPTERRS